MIRQILIGDFKNALTLFEDVKKGMIANGIDQWDDMYPNARIIEQDIRENVAFGYFCNHNLVGYIVCNETFNEEYNAVSWKFHEGTPLVVHRLAVRPEFQGLGIAKNLMLFAETKAKQDGYGTIRLDTFSLNPKALGFYKTLGYGLAGQVTFRKGLFYCFEKRV